MRRRWIPILGGIVILVLVIVVIARPNPNAPRYVAGTPASIPPFASTDYDWRADARTASGQAWIWVERGTNPHLYLCRLDDGAVLGELLNCGDPQLSTRDGTRLLVQGSEPPVATYTQKIADFFRNLTRRNARKLSHRMESFLVLDTTDDSVTRVGNASQITGAGSRWHPSPDFRRGYTMPTTTRGSEFILCDLEVPDFVRVSVQGTLMGWWDNDHVLIHSGTNQFDLFDVESQTSRSLFSPAEIESFLEQHGLTNDPAGLTAFAHWNGQDYDFYFSTKDEMYGPGTPPTFLLKANRNGPSLELLYHDFEFRWLGKLDRTATQYIYPGESGAVGRGGDGSVWLRNLTNGQVRMLVPPDNQGRYAIPRFYGQQVIYQSNGILHRMGIDGSNSVPLVRVTED